MTKTKTEGLKPCPFCGGEVKLDYFYDGKSKKYWSILCPFKLCLIKPSIRIGLETKKQAIKTWNTRTIETENARLREALEKMKIRYERADTGNGFVRGAVAWALYDDINKALARKDG